MKPDVPNNPTSGSFGVPDAAHAHGDAADAARLPQSPKPARSLKPWVFGSFALAGLSAVLSALALLFAAGVLAPLGDATNLERQLRSYLLANPEVIVESVNGMDARQQAAEENELTVVLAQRHDEVFNDPSSPVGTNANGDAILVEFFDYNCPYCRSATPILDKLEQDDKGLRLVFKEYPILGPGSVFAARAALASQKQGKYLAFHKAMMTYRGRITETSSLEIASEVGLDTERLKKDMQDPAIDETIKRNVALAQALRISGTPTFVAGKEILRGLADASAMKRLIASARGS
ncbi:DsbA family protein [Rhizobium sp. 9140]|uniref:DsbA family protein n=1 Tax=Rhizobium sp. 9140 TaxID=1761900 RepID=UPI00079313F3|nr:DsbA family protein [Rhizobium sp. 9140]CZT37760.1 Protein-disulfide isomerase [Rhizobium sp. 9140]